MRLATRLPILAACVTFAAIGPSGLIGSASAASQPTQIKTINPTSGPEYSSIAVKITGKNFNVAPGETTVSFGPEPAMSVSCASSTACTAMTPDDLPEGPVEVNVTSNGMTSVTPVTFTYETYSPPSDPIILASNGTADFTKKKFVDSYPGIFDPGNIYLQIPNTTGETVTLHGPTGTLTLYAGESAGYNLPVDEATPYPFQIRSGVFKKEHLTLKTKTPR